MSKQEKGLKRNTVDKYYTCPDAVSTCISYIESHIRIGHDADLVVEPSAGNGAFIAALKRLSAARVFYDLEPEHADIQRQNYLELDATSLGSKAGRKIHVIGNPPFGRQSSLAIQFIKKSCEFASSISFILPKSFKKDSMQKAFHRRFHLLFEIDVHPNSFLVNGAPHDVPCVFQIWERREVDRDVREKDVPRGFVFVSKSDAPDISFRRVGVNAGDVCSGADNLAEKSEQSHYFIKFNNGTSIEENLRALLTIHFGFNNTVGPKSVSKPELIREFNRLLPEELLPHTPASACDAGTR